MKKYEIKELPSKDVNVLYRPVLISYDMKNQMIEENAKFFDSEKEFTKELLYTGNGAKVILQLK